jgi:hypothetical protein
MRHNLSNSLKSRLGSILLVISLCLVSTGCTSLSDSLQKKFIRKRQYRRPSVAITTQGYEYRLSPEESYQRHYSLWTYWHSEIAEGMGSSRKKVMRASMEAVDQLIGLQRLLTPDYGAKLDRHVHLLREIYTDADTQRLTMVRRAQRVKDLERMQRLIHREFSWRTAVDHVLAEEILYGKQDAEEQQGFVKREGAVTILSDTADTASVD